MIKIWFYNQLNRKLAFELFLSTILIPIADSFYPKSKKINKTIDFAPCQLDGENPDFTGFLYATLDCVCAFHKH